MVLRVRLRRRGFGETAFAWLACLAEAHASARARVSEGWLGGRDSNPDTVVQSHVSYRWTTSQYGGLRAMSAKPLF